MTTDEIRAYGVSYKNIMVRAGVKINEPTLRAVNGLIDFLINLETIRELQEHPSEPFQADLVADELELTQ